MSTFDPSTKYAEQEEVFFDDGREIQLLHYIYGLPAAQLSKLRNSPDAVLQAIDDYARSQKYLMNIGMLKGRIVRDLIQQVKPQVMVELGGYIGYSAIAFAGEMKKSGAKNSKYYSLERNPEFAAVIMALADLAGLGDVVKVVIGSSTASIRRLQQEFNISQIDLLFLDHYKPLYVSDLKLCESLGMIGPGSVMAADNVITPGNPPYLKYVRMTCEEKKNEKASSNGKHGPDEFAERTKNQYIKREGVEEIEEVEGRWDLVYESELIKSFEPTGVPDGVEVTRCTGSSA